MSKKLITIIIALAITAAIGATVFAEPSGVDAPEGVAPASTAEPGKDTDEFVALIQEMSRNIKALRTQLQAEKQLDQKLRSEIRSLKSVKGPDESQLAAYKAEIQPLEAQPKELRKDLKKEENEKKNPNEAKIAELKAQIAQTEADIAAVNEKYKDVLAREEKNNSWRSELKELRKKLQPMYAALRAKITESKKLSQEVNALVESLKAALEAGDAANASDITDQMLAKLDALKANIAERVAQRNQMLEIINGYK